MSKIVRRSAPERARLVSQFRASNQTQEAFAAAHGLNVGTLRGWLYRRDARRAPRAFVEVALPPPCNVVVELAAGVRVQFSVMPPVAYLAEFARVLVC